MPRALPDGNKSFTQHLCIGAGFTIIELMLAFVVFALIMAVLFYALSSGESSKSVSSAKVELQAELRRVLDWITKDARQAVTWDIANNNPSSTYIKFRQVLGWDATNSAYILSANYIEYIYDANLKKVTRSDSGNPAQSWVFNNIMQPPFYTRDSSGNIVPLNGPDLRNYSKRLIVDLQGQKQVKPALNVTFSLMEEVRIRNE